MGQEEAVKTPATVVVAWELPVKTVADEDRDVLPENPRKPAKPPARRLSVPPPPGRPSMLGARSFSRGRAVRPEDDPFLAAYLACTRSGSGAPAAGGGGRRNGGGGASRPEPKGRRRFTWAGLGLSCKGSGAAVEQSMVKLAKRPELDPSRDT